MSLIKLTSRAKETGEPLTVWINANSISSFHATDEENWCRSAVFTKDHIFGGMLVVETPEEIVAKWPL